MRYTYLKIFQFCILNFIDYTITQRFDISIIKRCNRYIESYNRWILFLDPEE